MIKYGAEPSASNKWLFILTSDVTAEELSTGAAYSGFAAGVNLTGYDDTLRLWHVDNGAVTTLISTDVNWQNDIGTTGIVSIIITRDTEGLWSLEVLHEGETSGPWSGGCMATHTPKFSGVVYYYTSTRDRLLWIDNVSVDGTFVPDTVPPSVMSVTALTPRILQVNFDEEPDASVMKCSNISLASGKTILSVKRIMSAVYELHLDESIVNRTEDRLHFGNLCDMTGNCVSSLHSGFTPVYCETGDIVITEIMVDPSPSQQLPEDEYIEISNMTSDSLSLRDGIIIADSDTVLISTLWILKNESVILCSVSDTLIFSDYGRCAGLKSFPSLNDGGETLVLRDAAGRLIHSVTYTRDFYNDDLRSDGGWSMEMTDNENPFNAPYVWHASADPSGGTPGRKNSMIISRPDYRSPEIIATWPVGKDKVRIMFDESITGKFKGEDWSVNGRSAMYAVSDDIADRAFIISMGNDLNTSMVHSLVIPNTATDFAGNRPSAQEVMFGFPQAPAYGDVLFNELLFNPVAPCEDYIELFNNSSRIIDLSQVRLSSSAAGGSSTAALPFTSIQRQLLPGGYIALTTLREPLKNQYSCSEADNIFEVKYLPSMPDDAGTITLYDNSLNVIDRVDYKSSMHLLFLSGNDGIALEKVGTNLSSDYSYNWHSASETCNWGTPGAPNSVLVSEPEGKIGMTLSSERISPDGDGFEDVLAISIVPGGIDNIVTVTIFNDRGYVVKNLAERFVTGEKAIFVWDGKAENGSGLMPGLYLIIADCYNPAGNIRKWKDVCALIYR